MFPYQTAVLVHRIYTVLNRGFVRFPTRFLGALRDAYERCCTSKLCCKQELPQAHSTASKCCCKQVLLQAREPPQASAPASPVAGVATACGCRRCCCKRAHPCRHAPVILAVTIPPRAERTTKKKEGRYSRCGGFACTASIEERKVDRTSACWCWLLLLQNLLAVLQVGSAACTPSVLLVGCCKSAGAAARVI